MTKAEARLEALRIAVRPGLEVTAILSTAEAYYKFVTQDTEQDDAPQFETAKKKR